MKKASSVLVLGILVLSAYEAIASLYNIEAKNPYQVRQTLVLSDTTLDPETHLTLDILAKLPLGKSLQDITKFFDANKVSYVALGPESISLKNPDLSYYVVDGVSYTFSQFDYTDMSRQKLERLSLIKDGIYTNNNVRSLRLKEKQEYEILAKAIEEKLRAKFEPIANGYFKCGPNARCKAAVGTSKTYDGDDIIALYLIFELY